MLEEQQPNKSTRTFKEWKKALKKIITRHNPDEKIKIDDKKVQTYYDQGLMPDVCFKELFNK